MANVHVDDAALTAFVFDPQGPIRNDLRRRGRNVQRRARQLVGVNTGALRQSIHVTDLNTMTAPSISIGSDLEYALAHHEGTRPHVILPRTERLLRFKVGGKVVYARRVDHPGTQPNPYLARALREASK